MTRQPSEQEMRQAFGDDDVTRPELTEAEMHQAFMRQVFPQFAQGRSEGSPGLPKGIGRPDAAQPLSAPESREEQEHRAVMKQLFGLDPR